MGHITHRERWKNPWVICRNLKVPKSLTGAAVSGLNVAQILLCAVAARELPGFRLDVELSRWPAAKRHSVCPEEDTVKVFQPEPCQVVWPAASKGGTWS